MARHNCADCIHKDVCALWEIQNGIDDAECVYYRPTLTLQNEPLTLEQLRSYRVETDLASWHPEICDRAADCITDLMARCDRLEEARENANEACAKWETLCHMAEQERDAAVNCIKEIEDALNFQRISAISLRISEWRGQKED